MKMPFEVLMEHVAALTDEDKELPMGKLAERWGEPASRIADAIDAVRVMRGERTYISSAPFGPNEGDNLTVTESAGRADDFN